MGKASSSKKVARAARAGGRTSSGQPRSFLFPGVLTLVVVLGVALIVFARNDRVNEDQGGVPQLGDHIHLAYGVNACGAFLADIPEFESPIGIHTHGDGVLHVHPFSQLGTGVNATLERFLADAREDGGLDAAVSDDTINWLGEEYVEGDAKRCEGIDDPQIRVAYWDSATDPEGEPKITTGDFGDVRLQTDGGAITVFYGDADADIPKPPTASNLAELGAADGPTGTSLPDENDPEQQNTTTTEAGSTDGGDSETGTTGADEETDGGTEADTTGADEETDGGNAGDEGDTTGADDADQSDSASQ